jgi:intracellular multiplication protein IcmV
MAGFIKRRVTKTGRTLGNWMGLGLSVAVFMFMKEIFVMVFMPWKVLPVGTPETFDEAIARLNLTEEDLTDRKTMFLKQTVLFFIAGLAVIAYGVSLAFDHAVTGMLMCFAVSCVAFANAFRMHFWYFQTKHRKLGCTVKEWLNSSLRG